MEPISFSFIAAGIARNARMRLAKLIPSQVNTQMPSWEGHGENITTHDLTTPITDISYWEGRYALTKLYLEDELGKAGTLTIDDATVSISRQKQIVRTTIPGVVGTIKEYICDGDYDIKITVGIVAVRDGQIVDEYPEEGLRVVRKFLDAGHELLVHSTFLNIFDITDIVIKSHSISQETASNRQVIHIDAESSISYMIMPDKI